MRYLWEVRLEKSRGHCDTIELNVVAANDIEAIKRAKCEAKVLRGWSGRSYTCVWLKKSDQRIVA